MANWMRARFIDTVFDAFERYSASSSLVTLLISREAAWSRGKSVNLTQSMSTAHAAIEAALDTSLATQCSVGFDDTA